MNAILDQPRNITFKFDSNPQIPVDSLKYYLSLASSIHLQFYQF